MVICATLITYAANFGTPTIRKQKGLKKRRCEMESAFRHFNRTLAVFALLTGDHDVLCNRVRNGHGGQGVVADFDTTCLPDVKRSFGVN